MSECVSTGQLARPKRRPCRKPHTDRTQNTCGEATDDPGPVLSRKEPDLSVTLQMWKDAPSRSSLGHMEANICGSADKRTEHSSSLQRQKY